MSSPRKDPAEQLARELAREAGYLPDRWRAWLLDQLRRDYEAADLEQQRIDRLNQRMSEAAAVLRRVAEHLQLTDQAAQLALKMREFDAVPIRVRGDWTARRVADAIRGSWRLAKAVAFTNHRMPVGAERQYEKARGLTRKRRETRFVLGSIEEWLATNPVTNSKRDYERWRREQAPRDGRAIPGAEAIRRRLVMDWPEVVAAVEAGQLLNEPAPEEDDAAEILQEDDPRSGRRQGSKPYVLDPDLRARLIREGREAKNFNLRQLAELIDVSPSHLGLIERGKVKQTTFEIIVKLAIALDFALDDFAISE